jgi:glycogen(starch) synthase
MRVALVPSTYLPSVGGVQINTHSLAKRLKETGIDVSVVTGKNSLPSSYTVDDIYVQTLPFYLFRGTVKSFFAFIMRSIVCLVKGFLVFRRIKPELVNIHFLGANAFYITLLHMIMRFKIVVTLHGTIEAPYKDLARAEGYWEAKILNWTADRILHQASIIVCISQYLYRKIITRFPDLRNRCKIIPIGLEFPNFDQTKGARSNFILGAGRLGFEKGFDILIKAFEEASKFFPDFNLVLAGDGNERKNLEQMVASSKLTDKVLFLGEVERAKVMELLSECKIVVVPSRIEGFGAIILEAMAMGAPIVATSVGGIPELIDDGETAFLVAPENPQELAVKICFLLVNPDLLNYVSAQAKVKLQGKYDWHEIARQYLDVYQKALGFSECY